MSWERKVRTGAVAASVLVLGIVLSRTNLAEIRRAFTSIDPIWVLWVLVLNVLNTWIEAVRWKLILSAVKKRARLSSVLAGILVGVAGNTVLPLRLGDGARAYFVARKERVRLAGCFSTVVLDRAADVAFFLVLVVVTAFFFSLPPSVEYAGILIGGGLGVALVALIGLSAYRERNHAKAPRGIPGSWLSDQIAHFTEALSVLRNASILLPTGALSATSWAMRVAMTWAMFRAFHLDLPPAAAAVVLIFVNLGIAVVNSPANLGGFELAAVAAFKLLGLNTELGLSYAIALHIVEVVPMALAGALVLWLSGFKSAELLHPVSGDVAPQ